MRERESERERERETERQRDSKREKLNGLEWQNPEREKLQAVVESRSKYTKGQQKKKKKKNVLFNQTIQNNVQIFAIDLFLKQTHTQLLLICKMK